MKKETKAEIKARIKAEAAEVRRRVMDPEYNPPPKRRVYKPRPGPTGLPRGANLAGRGSSYNVDELVRLYHDGATIKAMSEKTGAHHSTITRLLSQAGVVLDRKAGRPLSEKCKAGHDMAEHAVPIKSGGRYCVLCKRQRNNEWYARKKEKKNG